MLDFGNDWDVTPIDSDDGMLTFKVKEGTSSTSFTDYTVNGETADASN